ncbi:MAG: hypothetical protein HY060_03380 [Proteobacteria bacterium]|nr:hypothetical protein [Pseudomonadota bacterium]
MTAVTSRAWCRLALATVLVVAATSGAAGSTIGPSAQLHEPPPAPTEILPPLPRDRGTVTWLPGSWQWTGIAGAEWQWQRGRYVAWPPRHTEPMLDRWDGAPSGRVGIDSD